jgi:hypothetical protein
MTLIPDNGSGELMGIPPKCFVFMSAAGGHQLRPSPSATSRPLADSAVEKTESLISQSGSGCRQF